MKDEVNCAFFVPSFIRLKALFERHHIGPAARIQEFIELCPEQPQRFLYRVTSSELWGSAGSVWDFAFSGSVPEAQAKAALEDDKRMMRLLLEIAEEGERQGDPGGAASSAATVLRRWRDEGLL